MCKKKLKLFDTKLKISISSLIRKLLKHLCMDVFYFFNLKITQFLQDGGSAIILS